MAYLQCNVNFRQRCWFPLDWLHNIFRWIQSRLKTIQPYPPSIASMFLLHEENLKNVIKTMKGSKLRGIKLINSQTVIKLLRPDSRALGTAGSGRTTGFINKWMLAPKKPAWREKQDLIVPKFGLRPLQSLLETIQGEPPFLLQQTTTKSKFSSKANAKWLISGQFI